MEWWEALILGLVQGLSEFLPISSTAHVTIAGRSLGVIDPDRPEEWTAFLAVIQLGTLLAVLAYFALDLLMMARAVVHPRRDPANNRLAWLIVLGTVPIGIVGFLLRDVIEGSFTKDLRVLGTALIAFGLALGLAETFSRRTRTIESLTWRDALIIGTAQCFSLIPGASRSGTTITGGFIAGLDRVSAARFSFLLSIPAIAASGLFELRIVIGMAQPLAPLLIATLAAALSGYAAIWSLLRFLQRRTTRAFVAYRLMLGAAILGLIATGTVSP